MGSITFTKNFIWGQYRGQTFDWGRAPPLPLQTAPAKEWCIYRAMT